MGVTNGVLNLDIGPLSGGWEGGKNIYLLRLYVFQSRTLWIISYPYYLLQSFVKLDMGDNDVLDYFQ